MEPARTRNALIIGLTALGLAACQGQPLRGVDMPGDGGTLIGATAGATAAQVFGDDVSTLETLLATVAGGVLGSQLIQRQNVEQALSQNQPVTLQPRGDERVVINPGATFERGGQLCREFTVSTAGTPVRQHTAAACQVGPDQWRLVRGIQ